MSELLFFSPLLQYNISPLSSEVPKSRSLERKQQEPIVLTKWRHSTYLLDLNDKVGPISFQCHHFVTVFYYFPYGKKYRDKAYHIIYNH